MLTIRQAIPADASEIARVEVETWRDTYAGILPDRMLLGMSQRRQAASWTRALATGRDGQQVLVAQDSTAGVVGFGSCGRAFASDLAYDGEVYTLYVLPDFQGQGVGRRLLERLFGVLLRQRLRSALVWVLADNPARFFYQAMGGALIAVREETVGGRTLSELGYGWPDVKRALAPSRRRAAP